MSNFVMPNNNSFMKYALKSVLGLTDIGVLHGVGVGPRTPPRCLEGVRKKFSMSNLTIPNNFCYMKYALKSGPALADVGVLHGDGLRTSSRCLEGVRKKFQITNLTIHNSICFMKYTLKSVSGLADVGVLHGDGDGPRTSPRCLERSGKSFK